MPTPKTGTIVGVRGQIAEVTFSDNKPTIHDLLVLEDNPEIKMEVYSSTDSETFYCRILSVNDQLSRGSKVINTEESILFPVGAEMLGQVVNIFGQPLRTPGAVSAEPNSTGPETKPESKPETKAAQAKTTSKIKKNQA